MGFLSNLIKALTPPGGTPSVEKLQSQLSSPDARVRQIAIERLSNLPTAQTVRMLADVIRHDEEYTVRKKAMTAMEQLGRKGAKDDFELTAALVEAAGDSNAQVRQPAATALDDRNAGNDGEPG